MKRSDIEPAAQSGQNSSLSGHFFTGKYLGSVDANDPLASPLQGRVSGLPPIRIHVGDDEVPAR
jgi:acetyl esterase/lipase